MDFIPAISPRYERPSHLHQLTNALARSEHEPVRVIVNLPPRHSKTETLLHYIAWRLKRRPWEIIAYVTYGADLTNSKSRLAREYAMRAGVELRGDATALHEWKTTQGGGAIFTSIGSTITGLGANVLIIDDPHKDRPEAESLLARDGVWNWYIGTGLDRVEVGGSVFLCQTRWHPDDMSGRLPRLHAQDNWEIINLPALGFDTLVDGKPVRVADEDGDALWPGRWPKLELLKKKRDEYEWRSKFQQQPVSRGTEVFHGPVFYTELPERFRIGKGTDLATTAKTRADWSCGVVLLEGGKNEQGLPIYYVAEVQRDQCEVPSFVPRLAGMDGRYPGPWHWFCNTVERGTAQMISASDSGVVVNAQLAVADKFVRAGPVAAAWNDGRVLVPRSNPAWLKPFVDELGVFTGLRDRHDDQVDALASAFQQLARHVEGHAPPPLDVRDAFDSRGLHDPT